VTTATPTRRHGPIRIDADGPIRILTLDRPDDLNAFNGDMHRAIATVWDDLSDDGDARACVLTGAGKAFSAGGDWAFMLETQQDEERRAAVMQEARRIITAMARFRLPVVAAVNGPAVGLGCSVAMLCDIVLIADTAFLSDPHVAVGLVAGDGGAATWPVHTSLLKAKEYLLTGRRIPAAVAVEIGLANRVVPAATVVDEAVALAREIAALPARAVQDTKRALNLHLEKALAGPMDVALLSERESMGSQAHIDAVAKLRAGRPG
jgi:enoyl-CoA hydratase